MDKRVVDVENKPAVAKLIQPFVVDDEHALSVSVREELFEHATSESCVASSPVLDSSTGEYNRPTMQSETPER